MLKLPGRRRSVKLTAEQQTLFDQPWFFNYSPLDLPTGPQSDEANRYQLESQGMVFRHIRDALLMCPKRPSGLVPTCTEGFYGIYALQRGAEKVRVSMIGSQLPHYNARYFYQSKIAAKMLAFEERCSFDITDIFQIEGSYDFGILADSLFHFPDPQAILAKLREVVHGPLVVFNTTVLRTNNKMVFEVPAPGRAWGSCFSHDKLLTMAVDSGWTVVNEQYKKLPADWVGEKNLSCFLCV